MLRSPIHLIGGGPGTMGSLRRHLKAALRELPPAGKRGPLIAYVGAASADHLAFQRMIGEELVRVGARVKAVKLASAGAKVSAARAVLEDCDVVFVSGGDVDAGMTVLRERDVLPLFAALASAGKPMIGISAGSIMLGRAWVRFSDHDAAAEPVLFPCMGIAPVYVDAHAEEEKWAELRVLLRLVAAAGEPAPVGYGLTRRGGIRVAPAAPSAPSKGPEITAFGTPAPRFVVRRGRVVAGRPLTPPPLKPSFHPSTTRKGALSFP